MYVLHMAFKMDDSLAWTRLPSLTINCLLFYGSNSIYLFYLLVVLREPVANEIKYLSNKSSDQNDQSKSKWE